MCPERRGTPCGTQSGVEEGRRLCGLSTFGTKAANRLDVALDTIPFNSGTTGFDALWMGVPLVALEGNWSGGRITSSVLKALGREEWIAQTEEEYVSIVRTLVEDVSHRKEIRESQRARMAASPLCDAEGLARALEGALEAMNDRWLEA